MMYENVALKLQLSPQELARTSVLMYLNHQLRLVESQLLILGQKYGVQTITELDQLVQTGQLHEAEAKPKPFEDFFEFDRLEAERDTLLDLLKDLA